MRRSTPPRRENPLPSLRSVQRFPGQPPKRNPPYSLPQLRSASGWKLRATEAAPASGVSRRGRFAHRSIAILLAVACSVAPTGCVLYSPTNLVIKVPDFYEYKAFKDGLHVIADPYIVPTKSEYLFDTDLTKKGVYTVHIILQNEGPNEFDFTESRVYLRREDGEIFTRMDREELEDRVLRNTAGRMLAFGAAGSLGFLIFSVPFALGAGLDSYLSNKAIRKDVGDRFREDRNLIEPQTLLQGFLFFRVSSGKDDAQEAFAKHYTLRIERLKNAATEEMFDVEIPIEKGAGRPSQSYLS